MTPSGGDTVLVRYIGRMNFHEIMIGSKGNLLGRTAQLIATRPGCPEGLARRAWGLASQHDEGAE